MIPSKTTTQAYPFEIAAAAFSTFLYAAAVHLIIHRSFQSGGSPPQAAFIVVLLIGFLFSDWSSRTRLPSLTGDIIRPPLFLVKSLLEICGVYFLVSSFLLVVEHEPVPPFQGVAGVLGPFSAFGMFLVITFFWDLFMLGVMQELKWVHLATSIVCGDASSKDEFKAYLACFEKWKKTRAQQIDKEYSQIKDAADRGKMGKINTHTVKLSIFTFLGKAFKANLAVVMQFLANHTAYANLIAGAAILCRETGIFNFKWSYLSRMVSWYWSLDLLWPVIIAILLFSVLVCAAKGRFWLLGSSVLLVALGGLARFGPLAGFADSAWRTTSLVIIIWSLWTVPYFLFSDEKPAAGNSKRIILQAFGGILILLTLLLLYSLLPSRALMILLAIQQVFANIFLQLAVVPPPPKDTGAKPEEGGKGDSISPAPLETMA